MSISKVINILLLLIVPVYIGNSLYEFYKLYHPKQCDLVVDKQCIEPLTIFRKDNDAPVQIRLFQSFSDNLQVGDPVELFRQNDFILKDGLFTNVTVNVANKRSINNLFIHVLLYPNNYDDSKKAIWASDLSVKAVDLRVPVDKEYNLLESEVKEDKVDPKKRALPTLHIAKTIKVAIISDMYSYSRNNIPSEFYNHMKIVGNNKYVPVLVKDFMKDRTTFYQQFDSNTIELSFQVRAISIGEFRLASNFETSFSKLKELGFKDHDFDQMKEIFCAINFYYLGMIITVCTVHIVVDFLSFTTDISFWKSRKDMRGLSMKVLVWNCFSDTIILLYLYEQKSSLLIIIPCGIRIVIELWKLSKATKTEVTFKYLIIPSFQCGQKSKDELETDQFDNEAMKYLYIIMTPICIGGAIYSLAYVPHKSWYSWLINSLANGIYGFGFIFMLPQLFLNYKLKSVAHLPWKPFMLKAFNTFIDDVFSMIVTMPTAHRIACFRDDIVFFIYLYQRYLYPVDKNRLDESIDEGSKQKIE
uniref:Cleft lip and palate transmembrane protein 1-like protein n=1 Tax=Rhabditophanes sp. KR3021 TaxID=114890 RepID=A0AC35TZT1_9BILA